ncbi:hypothetical protein NO932_06605 [Pelagibacterium sp. 26DY04]|uniref:hypothetical protein n=1 Tax=Pelagibacterium sp. 26DY04 TaxID=2967130 RepID=UPI002815F45F|nr:hypothetical protein [Pelagibacterium sp. 26DY04]WMT88276.1 hypothetical protein NO932_06605 [Pelagibacterium sp. 26DY04]
MQSREQLVTRALREVGAVGAGQTPSAEDYEAMDAEVEPIMADLAQRNIWTWGDPDQIDDAAAVHLAKIIANSAARQFGNVPDDSVRLYNEARLRELRVVILSGQPQTTDYY